jgi:Protein of unknown function (DUF1552).
VDFLLEDSRSLRNNLGRPDQRRLDEFLESLSEVESRLSRAQDWLGKALPQVDREAINLDVSPSGPTDYIRTMFDLIVLALETDTTRVAAYQICAEDGVGICDRFPTILGIGRRGHHQLTHTGWQERLGRVRPLSRRTVRLFSGSAGLDPRRGLAAPRQHDGAFRQRHQHHPQRSQLSDDSRGWRQHGPAPRPLLQA